MGIFAGQLMTIGLNFLGSPGAKRPGLPSFRKRTVRHSTMATKMFAPTVFPMASKLSRQSMASTFTALRATALWNSDDAPTAHKGALRVNVRRAGPSNPMARGEAMPVKQTRESIEAELYASKRERIALQLQELVREAHLVENDLRSLEDEHGIPEFARSRPLPERMAAVGMSRAVIDRVQMMLDALDMVRQGLSDDLPDDVKSELAAQADAELSGAEQLAAIVGSNRKASS